jgi:hypothetical protein
MNLQDRISDIRALTHNLVKENPEISSLTFSLFDCELDEIEAMAQSPIKYSNYHERAQAIVVSESTLAIFAYTKKCKPVSPVTPQFEMI